MKIPYRWVREFADLELTPAEAAERLVNAGVEVASVTPVAPHLRGVVVGRIEAIERELGESHGHRLVLCRVSTGRERVAVVCGAPNVAVGLHAAFAPPGATLPAGPDRDDARTVGTARIRDVESQGMLCSERELGLGEEHERGVLVVGADAPPGADLVAHLGLDDSVLEIEITPNRPDCLSVVGVARELAALTARRFRYPEIRLAERGEDAATLARVRVEAPDLCGRYTVRVIRGVRVGDSPAWMAARLRAVGLRPISNVVDVTNYVLWELGPPLHAFDADRVTAASDEDGRRVPTIVVRRAAAGERFTTLDGQERVLGDGTLVIADPARAIGLAGVMGGLNSEVSASTRDVLLESAYFNPASIRRTSRALGLKTDAAYRFERGADIDALVDASARTAQLMAELAGGTVARGMIDVYPAPRPRPRVRLRMERVERVIGVTPPRAEAVRILSGLGLPVTERADGLEVEVPSFRRDISMEDDLVEEVVRVWGYDRIVSTPPSGAISAVTEPDAFRQEQVVRRALVAAGLTDVIAYSFSNPALDAALAGAAAGSGGGRLGALPLVNPLSQEASLMRRHLLEGVLGVVATNHRRQQPDVRIFEVGKAYGLARDRVVERRGVAIALTGARADAAWYATAEAVVDVYDAKGLAEHVLAALGVRAPRVSSGGESAVFEPDCHATLLGEDGRSLAEFGEVRQAVRRAFDIDAPVFAAVVALDEVPPAPAGPHHEALPRFPSVPRDMAFVVDAEQTVTAAEIEAALAAEAGPLLRRLILFDVFRFPDGRRSLAWRLVFQAGDRTLTDDEINAIHARIARRVSERFGIALRGV